MARYCYVRRKRMAAIAIDLLAQSERRNVVREKGVRGFVPLLGAVRVRQASETGTSCVSSCTANGPDGAQQKTVSGRVRRCEEQQ